MSLLVREGAQSAINGRSAGARMKGNVLHKSYPCNQQKKQHLGSYELGCFIVGQHSNLF